VALFSHLDFHGYGELHIANDRETGMRSMVAIHDTRLGPALGGCRFVTYAGWEQAMVDALRLGRGMTYKAALAGLPLGGGKSVIWKPDGMESRLSPGTPLRRKLFHAFGRAVESLNGRYITAEDSGTNPEDMVDIATATTHVVGLPEENGGVGDPSPYTAIGVRRGIEAVAKEILGRSSLEGVHVAIQGVGHVGFALAKELAAAGCKLTVADIAFNRIKLCQEEISTDIEIADIFGILDVECDILAPCALGGVISGDNVRRLRCKAVAGAANNQLADSAVDKALHDKGIFWAPDYAVNAAGLIWVAQTACGLTKPQALERIDAIRETISEIARRARTEKAPPGKLADRMVEERLAAGTRV
jgi:leucine dehydrogenase